MNFFKLASERENSLDIVDDCFVFTGSSVLSDEVFDGVISEMKTEVEADCEVLYILSEPFSGKPTFACNKMSDFEKTRLGIAYFKALRDANEIPTFLQMFEQLSFQMRITGISNIPAFLCCNYQPSNMIPVYNFDFRPVEHSLDVCRRPIDYLSAQFITEAIINDVSYTCLFFDSYMLAVDGENILCAPYTRLHFGGETYIVEGQFECEKFETVWCEVKFDYENYEKISFFEQRKLKIDFLTEIELSNSLKLLCGDQVNSFTQFEISGGGIVIEEERIPLQSVALSEVNFYNSDRLITLEARDVCIFTHAPAALLESKLRQQNISFHYEHFNINELVDTICSFYCISREAGSSGRQFVENLFQLASGTLDVACEPVDNVTLLRVVQFQPQLELSSISLVQIQITASVFEPLMNLITQEREACTICIVDCGILLQHARILLLSTVCTIYLQQLTLYVSNQPPGDDENVEEAYQPCSAEQRHIFERACEHHDVACSIRMEWANELDDLVAEHFGAGKGGLAEQQLEFLLDKGPGESESFVNELVI